MGNWALKVRKELTMKVEEVRVEAWVHGVPVIIDEGLLGWWWRRVVVINFLESGG